VCALQAHMPITPPPPSPLHPLHLCPSIVTTKKYWFVTHLSLSNVPCEVRDGVRDVVVGHGQDGQLCNGALAPLDTPRTLIDGGQISVHVTCIQSPTEISLSELSCRRNPHIHLPGLNQRNPLCVQQLYATSATTTSPPTHVNKRTHKTTMPRATRSHQGTHVVPTPPIAMP
jgi:hypothetical protein